MENLFNPKAYRLFERRVYRNISLSISHTQEYLFLLPNAKGHCVVSCSSLAAINQMFDSYQYTCQFSLTIMNGITKLTICFMYVYVCVCVYSTSCLCASSICKKSFKFKFRRSVHTS